jgi:1-phosphatidylinositol-3-phosphate 5-kinase
LRTKSASPDPPTSFQYTIRSTTLSITFSVSDVSVLDARLPKLQVGPNVVKRRLGAGGAQAAFDGVMRKGWAETAQENVRGEIAGWIGGMRLRVHHLVSLLFGRRSMIIELKK